MVTETQSTPSNESTVHVEQENQLIAQRREKLQTIKKLDIEDSKPLRKTFL